MRRREKKYLLISVGHDNPATQEINFKTQDPNTAKIYSKRKNLVQPGSSGQLYRIINHDGTSVFCFSTNHMVSEGGMPRIREDPKTRVTMPTLDGLCMRLMLTGEYEFD